MNAITAIPASPLTEIGKRLHALEQEMIRLENLDLFDGQAYRQLDKVLHQAMVVEPVTLRDAAVLALCVADHIGALTSLIMPPEIELEIKKRIEFANSPILLALMKAGIRMDDVGPHDAEYEVSRHRSYMPTVWRGTLVS
jgi:hypothetical protein